MRVAAVQLCAGPDAGANLRAAEQAVRRAAAGGAQLVVLPEKWLAIGGRDVLAAQAQSWDGPLHRRLAALAGELGVHLIAGSISEAPPPGDPDERLFNTTLHLAPDGRTLARYRKVHQFDADVGGRRYRESAAERPGDRPVVAELAGDPAWRIGYAICFDLRFSGLFAAYARAGAGVVVLPSAFTEATTRAHWEPLVRARAIELGAYVIAPNQAGEHADGSRSGGRSLIVSPWGEVLARAGDGAPEVIAAELDHGAIAAAREALPVARLTQPAAYAALPGDGLPPGAAAPAGTARSA